MHVGTSDEFSRDTPIWTYICLCMYMHIGIHVCIELFTEKRDNTEADIHT